MSKIKELFNTFQADLIKDPSAIVFNNYGLNLRRSSYQLSEDDFSELLRVLKYEQHSQFVTQILDYQDSFPDYFFDHLIEKLVESRNKIYIYPCIRVFGGKETNHRIQSIIKDSSGRKKCNALFVLYYCIDEKYKWDEETESYETDYSNWTEFQDQDSVDHGKRRHIFDHVLGKQFYQSDETFILDRYSFLLDELLDNSNNLIVKYHIWLLLPNKLNSYPKELKPIAIEGLRLIKKLKIPSDASGLQRLIKGNVKLEKYAYEILGWEKRG